MRAPEAPYVCFRGERHVVAVIVGDVARKIIQIIFGRDGSVFVSFPYYEFTKGVINAARVWPGDKTLSLVQPAAKVTSHRVKYSHHPDGRVHFSQDGKILTRVRKQAQPLDEVNGHLFTAKVQGLDAFAGVPPVDDHERFVRSGRKEHVASSTAAPERITLNFYPDNQDLRAVGIHGYLFARDRLEAWLGRGKIGPTITSPTRPNRRFFTLSAPAGRPGDERYLLLECEEIPRLTDAESTLTFTGGFDPPQQGKPQGLLALAYPIDNFEELQERIGTVDLPQDGLRPPAKTPGRNDPCWCASGLKFKKCHGR